MSSITKIVVEPWSITHGDLMGELSVGQKVTKREYEIEFTDGTQDKYAEIFISGNVNMQVDD